MGPCGPADGRVGWARGLRPSALCLVGARRAAVLRSAGGVSGNPWADYRLAILRRAIRIVEIAADRLELVAQPGFRFVVERCLAAAVDLETGQLVRV